MVEPTVTSTILSIAGSILINVVSHFINRKLDEDSEKSVSPTGEPYNTVSMPDIKQMVVNEIEARVRDGSIGGSHKTQIIKLVMTELELLARRTKYLDVTEEEIKLHVEKSMTPFRKITAKEALLAELEDVIAKRREQLDEEPTISGDTELNKADVVQKIVVTPPQWKEIEPPQPKSRNQTLLEDLEREIWDRRNRLNGQREEK